MGTHQDLGFLFVIPCPGTCYSSVYLQGPVADQLRPYAGTNAVFRFWGDNIICGGVEGCSMNVDHWEQAEDCGVTPTASTSWGKLKTIYR